MKKKMLTLTAAAVMTMSMSITAFADGAWQHDDTGWRWLRFPNMYYIDQWKWIDSDADGIAECYYFGPRGYIYTNTTTPDGYIVDQDGKWVVDGIVQSKEMVPGVDDVISTTAPDVSNAVRDPNAVAQITTNDEVWNARGNWDSMYPFDMAYATPLEEGFRLGDGFYQYNYNGIPLRMQAAKIKDTDQYLLITLFGPAKTFLNNIPENGIEVDAFYANTGFTDPWGSLNHVQASTGNLDRVFGVPAASFRALWAENENYDNSIIYIQLTQGSDGNWYVYPDSSAYLATN